MSDTIVAIATPQGRSGIGVIRLSGAGAVPVALALTRTAEFEPRRATLRALSDPESGELIDEAILTFFRAPNSFTGEDVVEIACHGSPVVLRRVIDICLARGARLADPGEYTLRALANGRIDLAEAEAIRDLIDAQTQASARQAVRQMRGEFSHQLQPIKDELLDAIVVLESAIEFVEDDLPEVQSAELRQRLAKLSGSIGRIADTFAAGRLIREGLRVALVGRPNVGKSSLFNALLGHDRAIVTEIAGTTRDQIHEKITIGDIPVSLWDTAGLRETSDLVETIGVERSRRTMADADLVLIILDISEPLTAEDRAIIVGTSDLNRLFAINKIDKIASASSLKIEEWMNGVGADPSAPFIKISAKTEEGLDYLRKAIVRPFMGREEETAGFLVTDARHYDLLRRSQNEIVSSLKLLESAASEEIVLIGLHNALRFLGQITGETTTEDMLTRIFATFCIGK